MPWVKLDENFTDHPKVLAVSAWGRWLYIEGLCYSNRHLTDGFVSRAAVQTFDAHCRRKTDELVRHGLWERHDGGYAIHDYDRFQPSRADVLAERDAKARAGRRSGEVRRTRAAQSDRNGT